MIKQCSIHGLLTSMLLIVFSLMSNDAIAQKAIRGTVLDEANEPIIGASVLVKGTTNGSITVVDDDNMESYVGFPAEWLGQIKVGGPVTVEVPAAGKTLEGKILEINPIADTETKKFKIKFGIENKDRAVKDGMYAYATVPVGEVNVLSTKDSAIFIRELLSYVYKVEDGRARRIEITTGATNQPYTAITSDTIKEGDIIVVDGIFGLEEGDKVEEAGTEKSAEAQAK